MDALTVSRGSIHTGAGAAADGPRRSSSSRTARYPTSRLSIWTVESGGSRNAVISLPLNPMTATSPGTLAAVPWPRNLSRDWSRDYHAPHVLSSTLADTPTPEACSLSLSVVG